MKTNERKSFLHSVFTTALEGGIGYWSVAEEYHWGTDGGAKVVDDLDDFYAILSPAEEEWGLGVDHKVFITETGEPQQITDDQLLRVDMKVIERGVMRLIDNVIQATVEEDDTMDFSRKYLRQFVVAWLTDGREGDYDADVADMVVQLGLFGEVVYG